MNIKTYSELSQLKTFKERFNYLKLGGSIGIETFGFDRYLNQALYRSPEWRRVRQQVIIRDGACDLGVDGVGIYGRVIIHHMNPITEEQILNRDENIFDPEFLICTSIDTHNAIHYGADDPQAFELIERKPGDTCPWR